MHSFRSHLTILAAAWLILIAAPSFAEKPPREAAAKPRQTTAESEDRWFASSVAEWNRIIDEAERYFRGQERTFRQTENHQSLLASTREMVEAAARTAKDKLDETKTLLDALGPPPKEGEPPEATDIAALRTKYTAQVTALKAQISKATLALARIDRLEASVSEQTRERLAAKLSARWPVAVSPAVVVTAVPELVQVTYEFFESPLFWYRGLSPADVERLAAWRPILFALLAALLALVVRWQILRRLGPEPTVKSPHYARRLVAAIADAVARGIVPAAVIATVLIWIERHGSPLSGLFADVITSLLWAALVFILAYALPRAILAPGYPAWRLTALPEESARAICRRITCLAAVFAADLFYVRAAAGVPVSLETKSFYLFLLTVLQAAGVVWLSRDWLWQTAARKGAEEAASQGGNGAWRIVRRLTASIAVAAVLAGLFGYVVLGHFVISRLLLTGAIGGAILLLRGLIRDIAALILAAPAVRRRLDLKESEPSTLGFWTAMALDVLLLFASLLLVAPLWGVPWQDLSLWTSDILDGFAIGSITISPLALLLGVAAFGAAMLATKVVRRALLESLLPRTRMTVGAQHSLASAVSYAGFVVAGALAIAVMGVDLTNLAIVFGALSVGIGFGLQNVVNNFVSGLILLIERPINVGDWVIVAGLEGIVKRINIRSTEIETWQRASVIVPNAELLSNPLTNLTLHDRYGRIEVAIGVAYGSDVGRVREILLECARAASQVLTYPTPYVLFRDFGDNSLNFEVRCYTSNVMNRLSIGSDLRFAIDQRFREERIEIPFPQRVVHFAERQDEVARPARPPIQPPVADGE